MGKFYQYLWQHRMPGRKLNLDNGDALKQGSVDLLLINLAAPILYAHGAADGDMEKAEAGRCLECRLCHWLLRSKKRNLQRIMQNVFLFLRLNIDKAMFFC